MEKLKSNRSVQTFTPMCIDEHQEGDKWLTLSNDRLSKKITKEVHEPEELIIYKGQVVCMTYNKVINNTTSLFSQGSLAVIKDIKCDDNNNIVSVDVVLMPPGEKCTTVIDPNWKETTVCFRKTQPVSLERGIKARRIQLPFCYSNCFTIHKILGQTLPAIAMKISTDKGYFMWQIEMLTVAISRVHQLSENYVVGTINDTIECLKSILKLKSKNAIEINKRLKAINILTHDDEENSSIDVMSDRKVFMRMKSIHYQGPTYGFIYLSVSKTHPWTTHLGETRINLEKQINKDNSGLSGSELCDENWEVCAFVFGFKSEAVRKALHARVEEALRFSRRKEKPLAPWCLRKRFQDEVSKYQLNLKFMKCCRFCKDQIRMECQSKCIDLYEI